MKLSLEPAKLPEPVTLKGTRVTLVPLDAKTHAATLFEVTRGHPELWDYLVDGPPADAAEFEKTLEIRTGTADPFFFTILDNASGDPVGMASYLRIEPKHRVIEVGHILFSPRLQKTASATEAMYLMAKHAFEVLGYRRYEWKCNALNGPSRTAALRLGFTFEGVFRQHQIAKGKNRDTAWFSMLDVEWPDRKSALVQWLAPANFDAGDLQKRSLTSFRDQSERPG